MSHPVQVAVFASGGGTNLQALLDHQSAGGVPDASGTAPEEGCAYRVAVVVSDRESAGALTRGAAGGCESLVVRYYEGRQLDDIGSEILSVLESAGVQAIFLAGFLRMIPANVIRAFPRRILNVHPALLPAFGGKGMYGSHVHEAVLQAGASVSGPTVHFVDEDYDTGAIVAQWPVPVHPRDTPAALAARVLEAEHQLYPAVADQLARAIRAGDEMPRFCPPADAFVGGPWDRDSFADAMRRGFAAGG